MFLCNRNVYLTGCDNCLSSWLSGRANLAIKLLAQTCPNKKTVVCKVKKSLYVDGLYLIKIWFLMFVTWLIRLVQAYFWFILARSGKYNVNHCCLNKKWLPWAIGQPNCCSLIPQIFTHSSSVYSYTLRTLRACWSQSKFRILKIRESSARALFLYNCTLSISRSADAIAWASQRVDKRERRVDLFLNG